MVETYARTLCGSTCGDVKGHPNKVLGQECYAGGLASVTWELEDGTLQMMKRTSWN